MLNQSKWGESSSGNCGGTYEPDFESEDTVFEVGDGDNNAVKMNGRWRERKYERYEC
jgi:hypothetical protein